MSEKFPSLPYFLTIGLSIYIGLLEYGLNSAKIVRREKNGDQKKPVEKKISF
jgi:hypothetical protein